MKKPYWFKSSYIRFKMTKVLFTVISVFQKQDVARGKVLITSFGGLGDIIVRQKLIDLIAEKYGKENIKVLVKNNPEIVTIMGYEVIYFDRNSIKNIFKLVKFYKKILKYKFETLYLLESMGCTELFFLKNYKFKKIIGYECEILKNWNGKYEKILIPTKNEKALDVVYEFASKIDKDIKKESLIPDLKVAKREDDYISVGVGASGKFKVSSPKKLGEFLNYIKHTNPEMKFHLLGNGENEEKYADELKRIVDLVGKISLNDVIKEIANSKMYIGFDSGLYNLAYSLNKKIIVIVSRKESKIFHHDSNNIKLVMRNEGTYNSEHINDPVYNNNEMNEIYLETFSKAYESF